jgi:hypothetical protein
MRRNSPVTQNEYLLNEGTTLMSTTNTQSPTEYREVRSGQSGNKNYPPYAPDTSSEFCAFPLPDGANVRLKIRGDKRDFFK